MKFIDIRQDPWHTLGGEDGPMPSPNPAPHLLLTLEQWHAVREHWTPGLLAGVKLPNHVDVEMLEPDLPRLGLVALEFPKWTDGRAYSQARLLRARYRFGGEVRAIGEVLVDMLPLLARTGFDAVVMRPGYKQEAADLALRVVPTHYQGDVTVRQPVFARAAI